MELIRFLIIGAVAGCLARTFIKGGGFGLPINIVIGIIGAVAPCVRIVVTCKKKDSPGSLTPGVPGSETARGDENPGAYRRQKCYMRKPLKKQWYRSCYYPAVQAC